MISLPKHRPCCFPLLPALLLCVLLSAAIFKSAATGPATGRQAESSDADSTLREQRLAGFRFINPLLECDMPRPSAEGHIQTLEKLLLHYIDSLQQSGAISHVSVYYRDLNNGPWMGIHEKDNYAPASLLKVPIMIAALRQAETNSWYLTSKQTYTDPYADPFTPNITDPTPLQKDSLYTMLTFIENMIEHSDNTSKNIVLHSLSPGNLEQLFKDFGVSYNPDSLSGNYLSVKAYSAFFRILYNATYLSKEMSELALSILTNTGYNKGMVQSLPTGTVVAHKFGERTDNARKVFQLHDCGIVYHPRGAYLLCIMTRGQSFTVLQPVIGQLSQMVYNHLLH